MMCVGTPSVQSPPPIVMPPAPPPAPTPVHQNVVNAAQAQKTRSAAASGYAGTITNVGGGAGLLTPAFTTGSAGFKTLTGS
jgi:hypothetical protein